MSEISPATVESERHELLHACQLFEAIIRHAAYYLDSDEGRETGYSPEDALSPNALKFGTPVGNEGDLIAQYTGFTAIYPVVEQPLTAFVPSRMVLLVRPEFVEDWVAEVKAHLEEARKLIAEELTDPPPSENEEGKEGVKGEEEEGDSE